MSIQKVLERYKSINDPLFEKIAFTKIELAFIDTVEFQALRKCKQNGNVFDVFPSSEHTRFPHSLQVCYLSGEIYSLLIQNHKSIRNGAIGGEPELKVNDKWFQIVRLAGLLHDIGQSVMSHNFDKILKKLDHIKPTLKDHENRSVLLIHYMWQKYKEIFDSITKEDINLICAIIKGEPYGDYPNFLFEIVANHFCEVDADKICYLQMDSRSIGFDRKIPFRHIYEDNAKIMLCEDGKLHIVYSQKVADDIIELFAFRHKMFNKVYCNSKVIACELMRQNMLQLLIEVMDWVDMLNNYESNGHLWRQILTDEVFFLLPLRVLQPEIFQPLSMDKMEKLKKAYALYVNLQERKLYKECNEQNEENENTESVSFKLSYANCKENPLINVLCYDKNNFIKSLLQCNISRVNQNSHEEIKNIRYKTLF